MSTSTPSASSRGPLNVASTTYVAPCRRWAGPNASPRKLWAIIMWSRTVTVNTSDLPCRTVGIDDARIDDAPTERPRRPFGELGNHVGQVLEPRLPRQQRVEGGVAQQVERQGETLRVRTPATPGR